MLSMPSGAGTGARRIALALIDTTGLEGLSPSRRRREALCGGGGEKRIGGVVSAPLLHHADGFEDDSILRNHRPVVAAEALGCGAPKTGGSL